MHKDLRAEYGKLHLEKLASIIQSFPSRFPCARLGLRDQFIHFNYYSLHIHFLRLKKPHLLVFMEAFHHRGHLNYIFLSFFRLHRIFHFTSNHMREHCRWGLKIISQQDKLMFCVSFLPFLMLPSLFSLLLHIRREKKPHH